MGYEKHLVSLNYRYYCMYTLRIVFNAKYSDVQNNDQWPTTLTFSSGLRRERDGSIGQSSKFYPFQLYDCSKKYTNKIHL